ncbi:MAG TPA: hypothetical protein IGS52_09180 [Oscillatoriaceae cyanobacterium M33_DOE_052]|uniref:VanZ family protein n=1 Tax=Planktothricoides sp. SpSt-374 TaxID=2282167 RepID=A0A7C3VNU3_9CYAN|nr:hypothetical protein [Oscillatoriaceae cyanobacterium M33_DOE_052]
MRKTPVKLSRKWLMAGWCYFGLLLGIMLAADFGILPVALLSKIPHYDLIGHFWLYGIGSFVSHRALGQRMLVLVGYPLPLGPLVFAIFTVMEEMLQQILPHRTYNLFDMGASLLGIVIFYCLGEWWWRHRL